MATPGKLANRYARALYDKLKGSKASELVLGELELFSQTVQKHSELALLIASPGFSEADKTAVVLDIVDKMKLSKETQEILSGLSRMGRLDQLAAIVERLRIRLLQDEGVAPMQVWTASPVLADERSPIESKFSGLLGRKVQATYAVDPNLVGGLRVKAQGRTYEGTVSGWLETLQEKLVEGEA